MAQCRVTNQGWITITAEIRQRLDLALGNRVVFIRLLDGTVVMGVKTRSVNELRGLLKTSSLAINVQIEETHLGKD